MKRILVLGAGASGLAAAIAAAETAGPAAEVVVLEKNPRPGKKLLATGNGRCNLDNTAAGEAARYFSADPPLLAALLTTVNRADPLGWFASLGLWTRTDEAGRVYPASNQAADVVRLLASWAARRGVQLRCGCTVQRLWQTREGYSVQYLDPENRQQTLAAQAVICALGGKAGPQFGTDGFGPALLRQCGLAARPLYPCLVPLRCSPHAKALAGVRVKAVVSLWDGNRQLAAEQGEIQLTEYGLSGIAVMQLSCYLAPGRGPAAPWLQLDLMPALDEAELAGRLWQRAALLGSCTAEEYLLGLLHPAVGAAVWQAAFGAAPGPQPHGLDPSRCAALAAALKGWRFAGLAPCEWKTAQATGGGLGLGELEPGSFALRGLPGLYAVGETLDCTGSCGGFNLHWAFGSGLAAGRHAARRLAGQGGRTAKAGKGRQRG